MITPTVCGLEKETTEGKINLYLTKKRGQLICWIAVHDLNELTLAAPYLPTGADP